MQNLLPGVSHVKTYGDLPQFMVGFPQQIPKHELPAAHPGPIQMWVPPPPGIYYTTKIEGVEFLSDFGRVLWWIMIAYDPDSGQWPPIKPEEHNTPSTDRAYSIHKLFQ